MLYGCELQQGQMGTVARQEMFRAISRKWHRFLGFTADSRSGQGFKWRREDFDEAREEAWLRRFWWLGQVDISGQLHQMMSREEAAFQEIQEPVIWAVMRGKSLIVQVTGMGRGKSLMFMLLVYCSGDGVTIAVVPLLALWEDLHWRCCKSRIESRIWQSHRANAAASIMFMTPESAVTKGFQMFVNWLQGQQQHTTSLPASCS
jgi:superfamily II DNA helicase RecQ